MKRQHLQADCLQIFYTGPIYHTAIPVATAKLHQGEVNVCEQKMDAFVEFKLKGLLLVSKQQIFS